MSGGKPDAGGSAAKPLEAAGDAEMGTALRTLANAEAEAGDVTDLLRRVRGGIAASDASLRGRAQALASGVRLGLVAAAALAVLAGVAALALRPDSHAYPSLRMLVTLLLLGGVGVPVARAALRPWHRPQPTSRTTLWWLGLPFALALLLAALPAAHVWLPHTAPPAGRALWQHASACLALGFACGAPVFLLAWFVGRDTPRSALVATALVGLVGNLALQLHCPITEQAHLLAGHAMVGVAALSLLVIPWLAAARQRAR